MRYLENILVKNSLLNEGANMMIFPSLKQKEILSIKIIYLGKNEVCSWMIEYLTK